MITLLFSLLIFLIPSNLFLKLSEQSGYVQGLQVDYLIPKLYASDVVLLALIFLLVSRPKIRSTRTAQSGLAIVFLLLVVAQFFTPQPLVALLHLIKLIILGWLYWQLKEQRNQFNRTAIRTALASTILFQSLLAFWQFFTQSSLVGYLFLGEPELSSYSGLAKFSWFGAEMIEPYGTTAHPNVLAGVLVVYILILWQLLQKQPLKRREGPLALGAIALGLGALTLTASISALLSLGVGTVSVLFWHKPKVVQLLTIGFFLVFPFFNVVLVQLSNIPSLERRHLLNHAALQITKAHPIAGAGLQQFTAVLEQYAPNQELVRFVQPAHHVGLLWVAETGLLGALALVYILKKRPKTLPLGVLVLLPIATLDHYLLTLQTGQLLVLVSLLLLPPPKEPTATREVLADHH